MIGTFKDGALEAFYFEGAGKRTRKIPKALHAVIRRKLDQLRNAVDMNDLRVPPGNRLEALSGRLHGLHSIRVNDQRRIVFRWRQDTAFDVELSDYH